ncbi:MAG: hypothetical protein WC454_09835, partial [Phycisphaerae bacterium]
ETGKEGEKKGEKEESKNLETADKTAAQPNPVTGASQPTQASPAASHAVPGQAPREDVRPGMAGAALQEKTAPVAEKPPDDFIRFKCECGQKIKLHKKDAGKAGRCPKCSKWVEAPRQ